MMSAPERFVALDGLRGVAALIVVVSHISNFLNFKPTGFGAGQLGVMIFFALSGFLMCHVTDGLSVNRQNIIQFYTRRVARVVPLFLFVIVLSYIIFRNPIAGFVINPFRIDTLQEFLRHIFLIKGNGVLWTIPVELCFYFIFPIFLFVNKSRHALMVFVIIVLADGFFGNRIYNSWALSKDIPQFLKLAFYFHYFLLGMIVFQLQKHEKKTDAQTRFYDFSFLFFWFCLFLSYPKIYQSLFGIKLSIWNEPFLFVIIGGVLWTTIKSNLAASILGNVVSRFLGNISYSVYLTHIFCILFVTQSIGKADPFLFSLASVTLSILVASVTYFIVETPSRKFVNNLFSAKSI